MSNYNETLKTKAVALYSRVLFSDFIKYSGDLNSAKTMYRSVPGKHPLPAKCPRISFQGVNVAASIQMYGRYILGKHPCRPKSRVMFKRPWVLTWDAMVITILVRHPSPYIAG